MRVLVLCEYPSLNGGEHSLLEAAKCLDRRQVELSFAAPPCGALGDAIRRGGWHLQPFSCHGADGNRLPLPALRAALATLLADIRPDLVHANSVSMSRVSGPVAGEMRIPSLGHLRDIVRLNATSLAALGCHRRLLVVSQATRAWYLQAGLSAPDLRVEHNGVDLQRFSPGEPNGYLHAELGLDRRVRLIGNIGQIGLRKGTDLLLTAMQQVVAQCADVHVVLVGQRYSQKSESVEFEQGVRALASDGVLRGRVHWLGVRTDVADLLRELTLYVHAARQEPLGRVLLEAAACGRPIVATDAGGTREIFPDRPPSARIVPLDAAEPLAQAVRAVLDDPALAHQLGSAARERAREFDIAVVTRRLTAHYFDLARPEA